jgi:hypothetical protein
MRSTVRMRWGIIVCKSVRRGTSDLARVRSCGSSVTVMIVSSQSGAWARTSPCGPAMIDPPEKVFPPSVPTRFTRATNTPCSSAMSRASRSQRLRLAGTGPSSSRGQTPRAGDADRTKIVVAPSSAATVPVRLCHASSQISIAARPHSVSKARTSNPRSTNLSSSNSP